MESALILVEEATHLDHVTTMVSVIMVKTRITALPTVDATMTEYVNRVEEKTNIHVSVIVDVTRTLSVNRTEEKLLETVKIVPVVAEGIQEVLIRRVAIIHALVVG